MLRKPLFNYTLFAIAMAYLEATVVVYLRLLYYPDGFHFPLILLPAKITLIEIGREAATIIMLWMVAQIAAKDFRQKFAYFIFTFAVWDIFYYVWLKLFLDWPQEWLEWDILFLIPVPWVAPWITPVIISISFIVVSIIILKYPDRFAAKIFSASEWILEIVAGLIIIVSFTWDWQSKIESSAPDDFQWWLFCIGLVLGIFVFYSQFKKEIKN
jgi:hypothetical protein